MEYIISVTLILYACTGTSAFLQSHPDLASNLTLSDEAPKCRKDLGDHGKLRHWSRGHVFIVRSCGHIDFWAPIFKLV